MYISEFQKKKSLSLKSVNVEIGRLPAQTPMTGPVSSCIVLHNTFLMLLYYIRSNIMQYSAGARVGKIWFAWYGGRRGGGLRGTKLYRIIFEQPLNYHRSQRVLLMLIEIMFEKIKHCTNSTKSCKTFGNIWWRNIWTLFIWKFQSNMFFWISVLI